MVLTSKSTLLFVLFLSSFGSVSAQFTTKSIQLKPLGKSGWRYTYGIDRVKSAWSLQVPIEGLNDPEVNKYYNSFLKLQKSRGLAYLPGTVGFIAAVATENEDLLFASIIVLYAGIPVDLAICAVSHRRMGKAVDLYNISIAQRASLGLQTEKIDYQTLISLGFRHRF